MLGWLKGEIMERGLFSFDGRIGRGTYWRRWFFCLGLSIVGRLISATVGEPLVEQLTSLVLALFLTVQGVKRMHDVSKSGWYLLFPFYNLILLLTPGSAFRNEYDLDGSFVEPNGLKYFSYS